MCREYEPSKVFVFREQDPLIIHRKLENILIHQTSMRLSYRNHVVAH